MVHDNSMPHEAPASGAEFIHQWLPILPFIDQLRIRLVAIQPSDVDPPVCCLARHPGSRRSC
jgi:hypothetical protein